MTLCAVKSLVEIKAPAYTTVRRESPPPIPKKCVYKIAVYSFSEFN
jgi:hypothetical protein